MIWYIYIYMSYSHIPFLSHQNCCCPCRRYYILFWHCALLHAQVASTFYSTVSAVTSRAEADAAFLENEAAQRAMEGMEANVDTASAVLSDFREIRRDFSSDEFTDSIRNQLQGLEVGQVREFRGLSREQRRKVHLLAWGTWHAIAVLFSEFKSTDCSGHKSALDVWVTRKTNHRNGCEAVGCPDWRRS